MILFCRGYQVRDFGTRPLVSRGGIGRSPLVQRKQVAGSAEKNVKTNSSNNNLSKSVGFTQNTKSNEKGLLTTILGPRKSADGSSSKPKDPPSKKVEPSPAVHKASSAAVVTASQVNLFR